MLNIDKNDYIYKIYNKSLDLYRYGNEINKERNLDSIEFGDSKNYNKWDRIDYKCENEAKKYCKSIYQNLKQLKAHDVYIFEEHSDSENKALTQQQNYIAYERREQLQSIIDQIMDYQVKNNIVDYHPNVNSISGEIKDIVDKEIKAQEKKKWYQYKQKIEKQYNTADIVKIRNIIHQSLQPYHKDYTSSPKSSEIEAYFKRMRKNNGYDQWGKESKTSFSNFLWLPAVFSYSEKNNMYEVQGKLFHPLEQCADVVKLKEELGHLLTYFSKPLQETHNYFKTLHYNLMHDYSESQFSEIYDIKSKVDFSQKIHAIVKISEMEIAPNSTYSGQWHVEGYSSDNILYTCLYVIEQDENLTKGKLKFKRTPRSDDFPTPTNSQEQGAHQYCPHYEYLCDPYKLIPLGSLEIKENLMIIFPNQNIHKVKGIKNMTDQPLKRKIIAFFIVNHEDQPFTVNDVEFTKPIEVIKEYRMKDMYERSKNKQTEAQSFDYCEH
ncbi:hypothetical protein TTHERM_00129520 (macronuclear) [Tetrahymena thermophila SB210]|uniref:DUF4246 domain-containing protein n=1 Tax=Tetrahymena thermophila (strain SB210) TaxID=312017 RepID=I7MEE4_TETTS|nr:hypothetical protein TTHERM_00129520 [Tetrahymena thermophila SB210]EAR96175.1 hypothetical protein TTHERM_00129520 [Tetrahymena thermophila SB210]|eukprot:XP_001016420.1 hypothetical protein TTHERM_00129520 [Tetrahymena thermophila SB210]